MLIAKVLNALPLEPQMPNIPIFLFERLWFDEPKKNEGTTGCNSDGKGIVIVEAQIPFEPDHIHLDHFLQSRAMLLRIQSACSNSEARWVGSIRSRFR